MSTYLWLGTSGDILVPTRYRRHHDTSGTVGAEHGWDSVMEDKRRFCSFYYGMVFAAYVILVYQNYDIENLPFSTILQDMGILSGTAFIIKTHIVIGVGALFFYLGASGKSLRSAIREMELNWKQWMFTVLVCLPLYFLLWTLLIDGFEIGYLFSFGLSLLSSFLLVIALAAGVEYLGDGDTLFPHDEGTS